MTTPEQAAAAARANAEQMRRDGAYADTEKITLGPSGDQISHSKLFQWALIEPDTAVVRSTRRYGAPVTFLKQWLLRLLGQYTAQLTGQATRYNVALLRYVRTLEERVEALEAELRARDGAPPTGEPE